MWSAALCARQGASPHLTTPQWNSASGSTAWPPMQGLRCARALATAVMLGSSWRSVGWLSTEIAAQSRGKLGFRARAARTSPEGCTAFGLEGQRDLHAVACGSSGVVPDSEFI